MSDREELVEKLKNEFGTIQCGDEDVYFITEDNDWNVIIDLIEQSMWISVEDELPDPNQTVLVCGEWLMHPVQIAGVNKDGKWFDFCDRAYYEGTTHWQPLPPPPTEDR